MKFSLDAAGDAITFLLSAKAYHKEALYGASLVFADRAYVYLESRSGSRLSITLQGKKPLGEEGLKRLAGEFHNELLSQSLRWMVAKHNKKTKEAIEMQALFAAHSPAAAVPRKQ